MIQREWKTVKVVSFTDGRDEYGQVRKQGSTERNCEMVIKLYTQTNTNDIRFNDIETLGITRDNLITDKNQIIDGSNKYNVLYVIPSGKYTQVLMKKV